MPGDESAVTWPSGQIVTGAVLPCGPDQSIVTEARRASALRRAVSRRSCGESGGGGATARIAGTTTDAIVASTRRQTINSTSVTPRLARLVSDSRIRAHAVDGLQQCRGDETNDRGKREDENRLEETHPRAKCPVGDLAVDAACVQEHFT